ncbi:tRNA (adenosine(37)-N6)-threonylcarbamoyltransferase complex ATPase subunit type 1 TsaE [Pseudohalocynthiibacter aestuariivivens]|uniref:tRNA threonylcarbamoyladenosine biosynthesis protein TsaE n=1 Tax=Roseovarius pelagicus TaxID=2980108 RepID=A0ABY6D6U5_9RHOB|nr:MULTISPECIES: tRNA (adenosine(37)-N6)-threonylcarbamoyltransferase complex ATPase subunit type 1 TsaE [Rhodobacterales]QIE46176.1 tRNA (adenosine(37)-N6)-threonylcarbamoyltransferase complex ATPase subunit type 1 TsaE [Pseudohalocynthiibacter aestuariivivens]UXX81861.1 tRNA (adenosine(37)-N6)-threonylcarbamoyltransferase complex ATPase subunit type 1 TsaE [Roseovarius pelagicus]
MHSTNLICHANDPDVTSAIARRLGPRLGAGDVILLSGDVGAGKTHFARSMILSLLDQPEDVPSPTYTLVQTYPGKQAEIWHADLYRLSSAGEVIELGLTQAMEEAICLIEWPDRLADLAPESALHLTLSAPGAPQERSLSFSWSDPRWAALTAGLCDD